MDDPPSPRPPLLGASLRALLAPACLLCGTARGAAALQRVLCTDCAADFLADAAPRCPCCAAPMTLRDSLCGRCLREPPQYDATLALADYRPPLDALIVRLKFGHQLDLAHGLGLLLGRALASAVAAGRIDAAALLLPVPLAFERQRERGFNQAREIARSAARVAGLALRTDLLLRVRHQPPQEGLDLAARRRNLRGAFAVDSRHAAALAGRELLVVDDVMTSGSTLDAAALALKRAGARRVVNAVVARTP